jgi:TPR repeat protein
LKIGTNASLIVLILSLGLAAPVAADMRDDADEAYKRGDYATSLRNYRTRAERGDAHAQTNLGVMYNKGQGVTRDDIVAAMWYRKAARQGNAQAQFNLGGLLARGDGVQQDFVRSHMWFNLAAAAYPASATEERNKAVKNRDLVATNMTPAQIAEAERLARKWKPNK